MGQQIQVVEQGSRKDSSYYHIKKIHDNEFWIGGEYGILKKIDSLNNLSSLNLPTEGIDILKIERIGNYVFILTANAVIYRYDLETNTFLKKEFPAFKNRCFYDIIEFRNGQLLVCGGATGIAEGKKKIPRGFIATIDQDLEEIKVVWKHRWKFVWSLLEIENQGIFAVTFNGVNSRIIKSKDLTVWQKDRKIKGLVHQISHMDNQLWYCGAKSVSFKKNGIVGQMPVKNDHTIIHNTGCLWRLDAVDGHIIAVTYSGELLKLDKQGKIIEHLNVPKAFCLYDIEQISDSKLLVVGRGKTAYVLEIR